MKLIVQKYGGSSLETTERIREIANQIIQKKKLGYDLIVVVSAMGKTTDHLLKLAHEITSSPLARELDMLLSAGERISMSLLSMALNEKGQASISFTGSQSGIVTDTTHTNAKILEVRGDRIKQELQCGKIVIVAGFQGVSTNKEVTTLGRGGSDVTAVALAVGLGAIQCEFYKDVDGVYTRDPKLYADAKKIEKCDYSKIKALVEQGARVFHPQAIELAEKFSMPLYISSSFHGETGTTIERVGLLKKAFSTVSSPTCLK